MRRRWHAALAAIDFLAALALVIVFTSDPPGGSWKS
jgi:hypothetical protein